LSESSYGPTSSSSREPTRRKQPLVGDDGNSRSERERLPDVVTDRGNADLRAGSDDWHGRRSSTVVAIEMRCPQCDSIVSVESSPARVKRIDDGTGIRQTVIRDGGRRIVHECN
jgi:hypothetical protein